MQRVLLDIEEWPFAADRDIPEFVDVEVIVSGHALSFGEIRLVLEVIMEITKLPHVIRYFRTRFVFQRDNLFNDLLEIRKRVLGDDHPDTARLLYNLACFEAVQGDRSMAMDRLRQAVDAGWWKADLMTEDSDLESLRGPELDALIERVRQNAAD